ncbi:hypothetical protein PAAG_12498 [Paracoccidioides lutzii Pb01]|uniref:Fungal-type protein kinase domain-containing protein n=1 Tax=Paracoccidioides lutzii (strain ATCC MYA-826 / Pb01) TaxID=502779 RepID=A0A0A2V005_PARBA|nr:hypothetical protein PAAG_12498 [Paracoccidioides lutzii Pb01]KGQ00833.1 hypothetical protein PAAG_12498 [Paracoccidioides lutzii Pb01]
MANLSPHDYDIIAKHPFNDSLNQLQGPLREAEQTYDVSADPQNEICQKAISKLLAFFLRQEITLGLQSEISNHDVVSELVDIFGRIRKGDLVIQNASDVDICKAVLDLTATIPQSTPLASVPPTFYGTPVQQFISSSQRDSEQTRELDVKGFFNKYFEGKVWSDKADAICQRMLTPDSDENWAQFPDPPMQSDVLAWWLHLQGDLLSESHSIYYTTVSKADLTDSKTEQRADLLLRARSTSLSQGKHDWRDILVIGELKISEKEIRTKDTLLQISCYVRDVFATQPTRRSGIIDVNTDPRQFLQVFVGYTMMSDEELGLDTFIARNEDGSKSIIIKEPESSEEMILQLRKMLSFQHAIVCRGTTCFLTDDGEVEGVAKLSWVSDKWHPGVELLKLAAQKNVQGIARIIGHSTITSIADMRCGLTFDNKRHDFKSAFLSTTSSFHPSQPSAGS